jgi:hypothetical protein
MMDDPRGRLVQFLVHAGAAADVMDEEGNTPLIIAGYFDNSAEACRLLLHAGSCPLTSTLPFLSACCCTQVQARHHNQFELCSTACELWSMACELCSTACELWSMACELCSTACELWSLACELWSFVCELWSTACEMWSVYTTTFVSGFMAAGGTSFGPAAQRGD